MDDDKKKILYDGIKDTYDNLGTYEQFCEKLKDPEKRKSLYDAVSQDYDNIGTYEEFNDKLGFGVTPANGSTKQEKAEGSVPRTSAAPQPANQPAQAQAVEQAPSTPVTRTKVGETLPQTSSNISVLPRASHNADNYWMRQAVAVMENAEQQHLQESAKQLTKQQALTQQMTANPNDEYQKSILSAKNNTVYVNNIAKDDDANMIFESALATSRDLGANVVFGQPDVQKNYDLWRLNRGGGDKAPIPTQVTSTSKEALLNAAYRLQAEGAERPAWMSQKAWDEASRLTDKDVQNLAATLQKKSRKYMFNTKVGDEVYYSGVSSESVTGFKAPLQQVEDLYSIPFDVYTRYYLCPDGRVRPIQYQDPQTLVGGDAAAKEIRRRIYNEYITGTKLSDKVTMPIVGNFVADGDTSNCYFVGAIDRITDERIADNPFYYEYKTDKNGNPLKDKDGNYLIDEDKGEKLRTKSFNMGIEWIPVKKGQTVKQALSERRERFKQDVIKALPTKIEKLVTLSKQAKETLKEAEKLRQKYEDRIKNPTYDEKGNRIEKNIREELDNIKAIEDAIDQIEKAIGDYQDVYNKLKRGENVGNLEALWRGLSDLDNWTMGLWNLRKKLATNRTLNGNNNEVKDLLKTAYSLSQDAQSQFAKYVANDNYNIWYSAGYSIPFTIQAIATYGFGSSVARGIIGQATKLAGRFAERQILNFAIKGGSRLLSINVAAGIDTLFQTGRVTQNALQKYWGAFNYKYDKNGRIKYTGNSGGMSMGKAFVTSFLSNAKENVSERFGSFILDPITSKIHLNFGTDMKGAGMVLTHNNVGQFMSRYLPYEKLSRVIQSNAYQSIAGQTMKVLKRGGYDGVVNEYLEEVAGNIMSVPLGEMTWDDVIDKKQNTETFLSVALSSGFMLGFQSSAGSYGYFKNRRKIDKAFQMADAEGIRLFGYGAWNNITDGLVNCNDDVMVENLKRGVNDNTSLSKEQKTAITRYIGAQRMQAAFNNIVANENMSAKDGRALNDQNVSAALAYTEGRNMQNEEEYRRAEQEYNDTKEMATNALGIQGDIDTYLDGLGNTVAEQMQNAMEEAKEKGVDEKDATVALAAYLNARETRRGSHDAQEVDRDIRRWYVDKDIEQKRYEGDGSSSNVENKSVVATLEDGSTVYIIRGTIENNAVAGDNVIVRDETGETRMIPSSEVAGIVGEQNLDDLKQKAYDELEQEDRKTQSEINREVDLPLAGQGGFLIDGEGHRMEYHILSVMNDEKGNPASVIVRSSENKDYMIPIGTFNTQRMMGRKYEAIKDYLDENDEEYHATEGAMNERYLLTSEEEEAKPNDNAKPSDNGGTADNAKPKPRVGYDYSVKVEDEDGNVIDGRVSSTENGLLEVTFDKPFNGQTVARFTEEELNNVLQESHDADGNLVWSRDGERVQGEEAAPQEGSTEEPQEEETQEVSTETETPQDENLGGENAGTQEQIPKTQPTENKPHTALDRIPKDGKGNPIYEQTDAQTAWAALVEEAGNTDDAQEVANSMVEDKKKVLDKAKKKKLTGTTPQEKIASAKARKAAIEQAQNELDFWTAVAGEQKMVDEEERKRREEYDAMNEEEESEYGSYEYSQSDANVEEFEDDTDGAVVNLERESTEDTPQLTQEKGSETELSEDKKKKNGEEKENETEEEPKPIGKGIFGNIYDQFKGKVKAAFDFLMKNKSGDLLGVFHREDVGDIDLVWGDEKGGLTHIMRRHLEEQNDFSNVDELCKVINDVIKKGSVVKVNGDKVNIDYNGYRVSIRKNVRDEKGNIVEAKNWVVTAFDRSKPKGKKRRTSSSETLTTPSTNQTADGVTLPSNESSSTTKDTTSQSQDQEKGGKSSQTKGSGSSSTSAKGNTSASGGKNGTSTLIKGKKWESTSLPEKFKSNVRKGADSHDASWFIGKTRYGSTIAERDTINLLVEKFGSYIGVWNAYEDGKILLFGNEPALVKLCAAKEEESANASSDDANAQNKKASSTRAKKPTLRKKKPSTTKETTEEKPQEQPKTKEKKNPGRLGLVSDERMEELKKRLRDKLNNLNAGIDPEIVAIGAELAAGYIDRGVIKIEEFAKALVKDLGDVARPYIKILYNSGREWIEAEDAEFASEMTPYEEVKKFDAANFDKAEDEHKGVFDAAEIRAKEQKTEEETKKKKKAKEKKTESKHDFTVSKKTEEVPPFDGKDSGLIIGKERRKNYVNPKDLVFYDKNNKDSTASGVFYENGYAVMTDGYLLTIIQQIYPQEYEGKIVKDGEFLNGKFPGYKAIIVSEAKPFNDTQTIIEEFEKIPKETDLVSMGGNLFDYKRSEQLIKLSKKVKDARLYIGYFRIYGNLLILKGDGVYAMLLSKSYTVENARNSQHLSVYDMDNQTYNTKESSEVISTRPHEENTGDNITSQTKGNDTSSTKTKKPASRKKESSSSPKTKGKDKPRLQKASEDKTVSEREAALRDMVIDRLRESGMDVVTDEEEGQRVLDEANGEERMSAKKKRALETVSVSQSEKHQQTVISSTLGANVLKKLDTLADEYTNSQKNKEKTFIGSVAQALGAERHGSASEYATFETKNGKVITIRLANHNAKVSNFDNRDEQEGISIVVSAKENAGMTNDGNAHVVEYFYDAIDLRRAEGKPLADIVRSIKQALYSGEFKDTTGLAERQEVNANDGVRYFRTSNGQAYGYTVGGKIYIDPRIANAETPIHEYAHLWATALRKGNPEQWNNVVGLMKGTDVWEEVKKTYPELKTDDEIADEVLAQYSGRRGSERLRKMQQEIAEGDGSVFEKAEKTGLLGRVREAIAKVWEWVGDFLHIKYERAEQVADQVMRDLWNGVDPRKINVDEKVREQFIGEKGAERADHAEEANTRMENLGVAREMEKAGKDAKAVKMATGWERGADGKWRYEIPDGKYFKNGDAGFEKARARQSWSGELDKLEDRIFDGDELSEEENRRFEELAGKEAEFKAEFLKREKPHLADWLKNDELFKAYPELKGMGIVYAENTQGDVAGYYSRRDNQIVVNVNSSLDTESIIAHEVQHAIQDIEGFAKGGNTESIEREFQKAKAEWAARAYAHELEETAKELGEDYDQAAVEKALIKEYEDMDMSDWLPDKETRIMGFNYFARGYADHSLDDAIKQFRLKESPRADFNSYLEYRKLGGEVEARNVQSRMGMTPEERRASLATETEDVAREDQIFLRGGSYQFKKAEPSLFDEDVAATDSNIRYHKETDKNVLNRLENEPTIRTYRAMQVIDGKLYPPMAAKIGKELVEPNELGVWIRADENPNLAIADVDRKTGKQKVDKKTNELKWKFKLDKGGKDAVGKKATDVTAAYNPYWHTSRSPLNDQFKSAWIRPNIVIVECEVPESELSSGYKAERAKDAVGEVNWKSGVVTNQIHAQTGRSRQVILSRWCKPIRVLSDAEVAQKSREFIGEANVIIPENVLTPKQKKEFEKVGLKIGKPERGVNKTEQIEEALKRGLEVDNSLSGPASDYSASERFVSPTGMSGDEHFNDELIRYKNGSMDKNEVFHLGKPQGVMRLLLPDLPIVMRQRILRKGSVKKHNVDVAALANMPQYLSSPIFVFKRNDKALGVFTEMQDRDGKNVCVAIELNRKIQNGGDILEVNDVRSVHGRNVADIVYPIVQNGTLEWADKEKGLAYLSSASQYVQQEIDKQSLNDAANIIENFENPQVSDENVDSNSPNDDLFRRNEDNTHDQTSNNEAKRKAVDKVSQKLHLGNVVVHETADGLGGYRATAKGWFDPRTGQIHIVLSNNADVSDVTKTILHEAVAHYGLRAMLGNERFSQLINSRIEKAPKEVREKIYSLMAKHGYDQSVAAEEYLASLAEEEAMSGAVKKFLANVRYMIYKLLEAVGIRDKERPMLNDNELKYILWQSYRSRSKGEKSNFVFEAEKAAMEGRLGVGAFEADSDEGLLFRQNFEQQQKLQVRDEYERMINLESHKLMTAWVDSMQSLKDFQSAIEKAIGKKISDNDNAYYAAIALSSKNYAMMDLYKNTFYQHLLDCIGDFKETGFDYEDVTDYVMFKHGLERNEYMRNAEADKLFAEYQEKHPRGGKTRDDFYNALADKDYAGLRGKMARLNGTDIEDIDTATAEYCATKNVENFEQVAGSLCDNLWDAINACTKESLRIGYEAGLLSKETYDKISNMYQYYVPLRGFEETTSDEVYNYFGGDSQRMSAVYKKAKGRSSEADDPFANIGNMAELAIMQANRNRYKQKFLNLALNHPSDLVSIHEMYIHFDPSTGKWEAVTYPSTEGMDEQQAKDTIDKFVEDMEEKVENNPDEYKRASERPDIPYRVIVGKNEHQIHIKRNGKDYVLTINGNPMLAQAVNGLFNPDTDINPFMAAIKRGTHWLAALATQKNISFSISNFIRDLTYASNISVKENAAYAKQYRKNICTTIKNIFGLIGRQKSGKLDMNNPLDRMFHEFILNGGETGYTFMHSVEEYKGEIAKALNKSNGKTKHYVVNDIWRAYVKAADYANRASEDIVRFTAYMTSRQEGRSIERAVQDAKEVSVNFNRKGSGSKSAGRPLQNGNTFNFFSSYTADFFKNFYMFMNAGIQGLGNFAKLAYHNPKAFTAWVSVPFALGALAPILGTAMCGAFGGDPDDYYYIPEYKRRQNICIYVGNGNWLTIPLAIELRTFYGMGEIISSQLTGGTNYEGYELAKKIVGQFSQILPLDVMEEGAMVFVPSFFRPVAEVAVNKDWTGMPVYKESFNKYTPAWQNHYNSTNGTFVNASKWLNEIGGGDDVSRGTEILQINPGIVEHLVEGYTSGTGVLFNRTYKTVRDAVSREELQLRNVPFVNIVLTHTDDRTQDMGINERFYNEEQKGDKLIHDYNGYVKQLQNTGDKKYQQKVEEIDNSPKIASYALWKNYSRIVKPYNEELKTETDAIKIAAIKRTMAKLKRATLEASQKIRECDNINEADNILNHAYDNIDW